MLKTRLLALSVLVLGALLGWFVFAHATLSAKASGAFPFKLGLDLSGGTHLVYKADVSRLAEGENVADAMTALRDTIERRVNLFGVAEPIVQTEQSGILATEHQERLIVELPGVTDTQKAIEMIGKTPVLEFRLASTTQVGTTTQTVFLPTKLTGRYLKRASLSFGQGRAGLSNEPVVNLQFNSEGKDLFARITKENTGKILGIFLDGQPISTPVINEPILNGSAIISGSFKAEEARELVRNLNYGSLPIPISLLSAQTVGASLGKDALARGVTAGLIGLIAVALFLIFWYRFAGLVAVVALSLYIIIMLALFKFFHITLTSAGVAGFILSIGLAVDANVLIFERMKEELQSGKWLHNAIQDGFKRAWLSIRDGNLSSIITGIILFWFGTSIVEGFALVFVLGVLVSMFSAITVTRTLLLVVKDREYKGLTKFLFGSGVK